MFPWEVDSHVEAQFADAEDREFDALVKESQRLLAQATAKHFAVLAEAKKRRSHAARGYRSQATWVSSLIKLSKSQRGGREPELLPSVGARAVAFVQDVHDQLGGLTIPENGQMLCPACHRHKTQLFTQVLARNT